MLAGHTGNLQSLFDVPAALARNVAQAPIANMQ
jgi:hypothetical protein